MDSRAEREFREFVESRSPALRPFRVRGTGELHAAEDLVKGALVKRVHRWHKVGNSEAYVRRTTTTTTPAAGDVDARLDLRRALIRLTVRQRAVLVLRFYEDLPEREVAEIMGCSVGTVGSRTARALARL